MIATRDQNSVEEAESSRGDAGFFEIAVRRAVVRRATFMALVVGNVIGALNHGDKIVMGLMSNGDWIKVGLTFLIPYTVSTISSVLATRDQERFLSAGSRVGSQRNDP